ncbi:MAG: hypothetical protein IT578_12300 [Verrucomicrobiae bacterium]|nr:hypothetical protein [Verrucomicrobiae bacterium]
MIELLVVVAIIAVLAAMLAPALKSARDKAKQAKCMNNLKQLGILFSVYAGDSNGFLPPVLKYTGPGVGVTWYGALDEAGLLPIYGGSSTAWNNNPNSIAACPSRDSPPQHVSDEFHYAMPSVQYITGSSRPKLVGDSLVDINGVGGVRFEEIENPSSHMMIADATDYKIQRDHWLNPPAIKFAIYPHNNGMNILYADLHVGWFQGPLPTGNTNQNPPPPF